MIFLFVFLIENFLLIIKVWDNICENNLLCNEVSKWKFIIFVSWGWYFNSDVEFNESLILLW